MLAFAHFPARIDLSIQLRESACWWVLVGASVRQTGRRHHINTPRYCAWPLPPPAARSAATPSLTAPQPRRSAPDTLCRPRLPPHPSHPECSDAERRCCGVSSPAASTRGASAPSRGRSPYFHGTPPRRSGLHSSRASLPCWTSNHPSIAVPTVSVRARVQPAPARRAPSTRSSQRSQPPSLHPATSDTLRRSSTPRSPCPHRSPIDCCRGVSHRRQAQRPRPLRPRPRSLTTPATPPTPITARAGADR